MTSLEFFLTVYFIISLVIYLYLSFKIKDYREDVKWLKSLKANAESDFIEHRRILKVVEIDRVKAVADLQKIRNIVDGKGGF